MCGSRVVPLPIRCLLYSGKLDWPYCTSPRRLRGGHSDPLDVRTSWADEHQEGGAQQRNSSAGSGHCARAMSLLHTGEQSRNGHSRDGHAQPAKRGSAEHRGEREEVHSDDGTDPDGHESRRASAEQLETAPVQSSGCPA